MSLRSAALSSAVAAFILSGCATPAPQPVAIQAPPAVVNPAAALPAVPTLKRKVAIARFSNSTNYGRALLIGTEVDPLAEQAADMFMARLVDSGRFLIFERDDIDAIQREQALNLDSATRLVGVDALIVGSVTQFGRRTEGQTGFLSSTRRQTAEATVEIRLVDVQTGQAFFSTEGTGSASVEAGEVAGFGAQAAYDSTLNDAAIAAAVDDLMNNVIQQLEGRPWHPDILEVTGNQVMISGGPGQGLRTGDRFRVERPGRTVVSGQTGLPITLPGEVIAEVEVLSFFGAGEAEGAVARVVSGIVPAENVQSLIVSEIR
jgi:curli biogenesis system outer membrane secretion channel CsgG